MRNLFTTIRVPVVLCMVTVLLMMWLVLRLQHLHLAEIKSHIKNLPTLPVYAAFKDLSLASLSKNIPDSSDKVLPEEIKNIKKSVTMMPDQSHSSLTDGELSALTQVLEMRLAVASVDREVVSNRTCDLLAAEKNVRGPCVETKCSQTFHPIPKERIRQLTAPHLRLNSKQYEAILSVAKNVSRQKYLFVTAASSNHYKESQALVLNLRKTIFSKLPPSSYSFHYFDLGLTPLERKRVVKNCNCTLQTLSFDKFPDHVKQLNCYAWKPIIIKALLQKADLLVYMDTSVRFKDMNLDRFFAAVRLWGAQFIHNPDSIPNHTLESMFKFYGDSSCLYAPFPELLAGFSVFYNEHFMNKIILDPWVACALNKSCMCPVDPSSVRFCPHKERRSGQCHRFDLSSLTIQFAKLYGDKFGHLVMKSNDIPKILRDDVMDFFKDRKKKK